MDRLMAVVVFLVWISIVNPSVVAEEEDKGHTLRDGQNEGISPTVLDYQYYSTLVRQLCRYVGVAYVRHPSNPRCKYVWCWNDTSFSMDCPPGRTAHPFFYWSRRDPCTERDLKAECLLGMLEETHGSRDKGVQQAGSSHGFTEEEIHDVREVADNRFSEASPTHAGHGNGIEDIYPDIV